MTVIVGAQTFAEAVTLFCDLTKLTEANIWRMCKI
jgi:hypothetical protein